nr:unnamed protein product [Callosobruchus analis]
MASDNMPVVIKDLNAGLGKHSSVRQVIDRFLNVDRKKKDSFVLKRNNSDCSVYSDSSSWSSSSKNSAKKLVNFVK